MPPPPFIIVADRGELKAFAVDRTATRDPFPRLVFGLTLRELHQRYAERFTDSAGAFPARGTDGQGNSTAERMTLVAEDDMRSFRRVAHEIEMLLKEHNPDRWAFAAPSEINGAILDGLDTSLKGRLAQNLRRDLVNTDSAQLLKHFTEE